MLTSHTRLGTKRVILLPLTTTRFTGGVSPAVAYLFSTFPNSLSRAPSSYVYKLTWVQIDHTS